MGFPAVKDLKMRLQLENIGMIRHADIKLDGLTVIAGENDTGKSTVGKLIFSLIKAFNRYEQDLNESKSDRAFELIEKTYFQLRKEYDFKENSEIKGAFYPPSFSMELKKTEDPIALIEDKIFLLRKINAFDVIENLESIKKTYIEDENKTLIIKRALTKAFISEFYFELTPKNSDLVSTINLSEGANKIFGISIERNKVKYLELHDDLFFNDVTFIETPIFLQMYELIRSASTLFEISEDRSERVFRIARPKVALHVKDLISKLENAQYFSIQQVSLFESKLDALLADITNITKGSGFSFEKQDRDFYFNKNGDTKFKSINTATGLKSFGIIQLLIQANMLNDRSLLIIDEPEIHLHPKWQVEYAKLIVTLVKNDIPVLLTSHSPEMIQALKTFSEKMGLEDRTAYYLAESNGISSEIKDVTENINEIFIKLAEPLHNLVWD
jgi:predicted ATP-dependent endonuclease of OLD family